MKMRRKLISIMAAGALALSAAGACLCAPVAAQAAASGGAAGGGATIYVDPQEGLDSNDGTQDAPVQTLKRAQELVRGLVQDMDGDVTVRLRGGRHTLEETLELGPQDSGRGGFSVVWTSYEGEEAEISGGVRITDWTLHDAERNIWAAPAQGVISRDFYVDGEMAVRARTDLEAVNVDSAFKQIMVKPGSLPESFTRPEDMEVLYQENGWRWGIAHVEAMGEINGYPMLQCTEASFIANPENKNIKYLENAYELLDEPGEWYLDTKEDCVYYMPKEGQDMSRADALLGRLETFFMLLGTAEGPVEGIAFEGLTFSHTTWLLPLSEHGLHLVQSAMLPYAPYQGDGSGYVPAPLSSTIIRGGNITNWIPSTSSCVYGEYVDGIRFSGNRFQCLGNGGVHLGRATKNSAIEGNVFRELGAGAVILGGFHFNGIDHFPLESEEGLKVLTENNRVSDNYIEGMGRVNKGCSAILVGLSAGTTIDHNTIIDFPYTGISMGWGWGSHDFDYDEFALVGNSITDNYLEDGMNFVFNDGGAIYTLGRQDDSVITGNYIEQMSKGRGIYLDDGSYGFTVTGNVVRDSDRNFTYKGDYNYIFDNYTVNAQREDSDMRLPIGDTSVYRLENNDLWDENTVAAIRAGAGASGPHVPGREEAAGTQPGEAEESVETAASAEAEAAGTQPGEAGESVETTASAEAEAAGTQPGEAGEPVETAAPADPEPADKGAAPQEAQDGAGVPAAAWLLLPVLAAGAAAGVVFARKRKK